MFRSNNTKITPVLIVVAQVTEMIIGPQITSIGDALAKQKYSNWEDCRDHYSKIGVRTISRITMMIMELEHHKVLVKANPQVKTVK
jgi:hypothetical protein